MAQTSSQSQSVAPLINQRLDLITDSIENYDESDAAVESDAALADLWSDLKNLEDSVEELRKEVLEPELEERVAPGDRLHGVQRIESHRKYVTEDVGAVIARAIGQGIDYTDFVSINASDLADLHPDLTTIERNEYTYFR